MENSETTNAKELDVIGHKLFGDYYIGTFPANGVPLLHKDHQCCIFNNKNVNDPGEHWLALFNQNGKVFVFDTYNRDVSLLNKYFLNKNWINPSHIVLESIYSKDCGQQCMAFLAVCFKYGAISFFNSFKD